MTIKKFKPITSTLRYKTIRETYHLSPGGVPPKLISKMNQKAGRSSSGRISVWWRGGGHKRRYRVIDWKRNKEGIHGYVDSFHYDPNRSADLALIRYVDGDYRFILSPDGLKRGDKIVAAQNAPIRTGNCLPLMKIPPGSVIHNVELSPGRGAQMIRSAGSSAVLAGEDGKYSIIKLASGETRKVNHNCRATIGQVGNREHNLVVLGKAGTSRWLGRRPHVRGVVMNPVDHPLGGGEGKSAGGRHPCTPWGKPTKGYKTRKKNKVSNRFIMQRRINKRIANR